MKPADQDPHSFHPYKESISIYVDRASQKFMLHLGGIIVCTINCADILTDINYATLTFLCVFQKTVDCELPLL